MAVIDDGGHVAVDAMAVEATDFVELLSCNGTEPLFPALAIGIAAQTVAARVGSDSPTARGGDEDAHRACG